MPIMNSNLQLLDHLRNVDNADQVVAQITLAATEACVLYRATGRRLPGQPDVPSLQQMVNYLRSLVDAAVESYQNTLRAMPKGIDPSDAEGFESDEVFEVLVSCYPGAPTYLRVTMSLHIGEGL